MACKDNPLGDLTEEQIQMLSQEITQEVYGKLRCRCCRKYCHPPFRQCILGHLVCAICFDEEDTCKICDSENSVARLFVLEKLYLHLDFFCKYAEYDCKFYGQGKSLIEHHKICIHFVTGCPDLLCSWKGKPKNLFNHYRNYHPLRIIKDEEDYKFVSDLLPIGNCVYMPNLIMVFERVFMVVIIVTPSVKYLDYIATNLEPFNVDDFDLAIDFEMENKELSSVNLSFVYSTNEMREDGLESHKINDFYVTADNIVCDYTIRIEKKKD